MARSKHYLVPPDRAAELAIMGHDLMLALRLIQVKYNVRFRTESSVEVYDRKFKLPEGYEYVATLDFDRPGQPRFEVCEVIPEHRPKRRPKT